MIKKFIINFCLEKKKIIICHNASTIKGARTQKKFRSKTPAFCGAPQKRGYVIR